MTVTVAPAGYTGQADYYCTGTNDDILINAAILYVSTAYGGGTVHLLEGDFYVTAKLWHTGTRTTAIALKSNVSLRGSGPGTKIHSDLTFASGSSFAIQVGGPVAADFISNVIISDLCLSEVTGTAVDQYGISGDSVSNLTIQNITSNAGLTAHIRITGSSYAIINKCTIDTSILAAGAIGIDVQSTNCLITENIIRSLRSSANVIGIAVQKEGAIIGNNSIYDLSSSSGAATYVAGILTASSSDRASIKNNTIEQVKNSITAANAFGIKNTVGVNCGITSNYCYNNGSDTGIANTNGNNFSDAGTDTQVYSNSWQSPVAGEPSCGTLHLSFSTLLNTDPANTNWTACASNAPAGCKAIYIYGRWQGVTAGRNLSISDANAGITHLFDTLQVANVEKDFTGIVFLDTSYQFWWQVTNVDVNTLLINRIGYFL